MSLAFHKLLGLFSVKVENNTHNKCISTKRIAIMVKNPDTTENKVWATNSVDISKSLIFTKDEKEQFNAAKNKRGRTSDSSGWQIIVSAGIGWNILVFMPTDTRIWQWNVILQMSNWRVFRGQFVFLDDRRYVPLIVCSLTDQFT